MFQDDGSDMSVSCTFQPPQASTSADPFSKRVPEAAKKKPAARKTYDDDEDVSPMSSDLVGGV